MAVLFLLLGACAVVWALPSYNWRDAITSDDEFQRIQEHLNSGTQR
jgi:hypothetical protein